MLPLEQHSDHQGRRLPHWLGGSLLVLLAIAGLVLVLAHGRADQLARLQPDRAVLLNPGQGLALSLLAERALAEGEMDAAQELATRAATAGFFNGRALRLLGALAERQGDPERALALMETAAAVQPRDTATQYWLALHAVSAQDAAAAMQRLDRVLRFQPAVMDELFPLLGTFASNPVGLRAMLPYLAKRPFWRAGFLDRMLRQADLAVVIRLRKLLEAGEGGFSDGETAALMAALSSRRDWQGMRELLGPDAPLLRDGNFAGTQEGATPAWLLQRVKGGDVRLGEDGLRTYFYGRKVESALARQQLLLPPGRYELSGQVWLSELEGPRGLAWHLTCESIHAPSLASSEAFLGSAGWRGWLMSFEIPEQGCGGQWLSLAVPARIAVERELRGEAAFRGLSIIRLGDVAAQAR